MGRPGWSPARSAGSFARPAFGHSVRPASATDSDTLYCSCHDFGRCGSSLARRFSADSQICRAGNHAGRERSALRHLGPAARHFNPRRTRANLPATRQSLELCPHVGLQHLGGFEFPRDRRIQSRAGDRLHLPSCVRLCEQPGEPAQRCHPVSRRRTRTDFARHVPLRRCAADRAGSLRDCSFDLPEPADCQPIR